MNHPSILALTAALWLAIAAPAARTPAASVAAAVATQRSSHAAASRPFHLAKTSCAIGARLALAVRFPVGLGLGLAVCTAGAVMQLEDWLRARSTAL